MVARHGSLWEKVAFRENPEITDGTLETQMMADILLSFLSLQLNVLHSERVLPLPDVKEQPLIKQYSVLKGNVIPS